MKHFAHTGLTFDDVSMMTQYADFLPSETKLGARLTRNIRMNIPFISAAMDTVTESDMAIAMALLGGIGVIHKNLPPYDQRTHLKRVKYYLNGFLKKARTLTPDHTILDIKKLKEEKKFTFSSFPILDENHKLVGIITSREFKYCDDPNMRMRDIMIPNPITAPTGTTIEQAYEIMKKDKISILPIVDQNGIFDGMYCFKDVRDILQSSHPDYNLDDKHQLRCGAAVGPKDYERIECLMESICDLLVVDTAHGHTQGVMEITKWIKSRFPQVDVITGNVANPDAVPDLIKAGADAIKVGVGPGSICTTRVVTGVGIPQITAIYQCAHAAKEEVPIIADGGIRYTGDVPKAIAAGASSIMMGGALAGTDQSPGEKILYQGRRYVVYRGMGSLEAMKERMGSRERYGQSDVPLEKLIPEGIEGMVPYAGDVNEVMGQFIGGLKSSLGYNGCKTIQELREKGIFIKVTEAGYKESHPHNVTITKDAPNYKIEQV
ncbi:IMP dehydrogenase [Candidatus Sumerlaeota bacterium]|nr:IMP dehydrogenase [Candidatus Sumerlaeota bacterium]